MGLFSKKPRLDEIVQELGAVELRATDAEFVRLGSSTGRAVQAVARSDGLTVEDRGRVVSQAKWQEIRAFASPISHPQVSGPIGFGFKISVPDSAEVRLMFTAVGDLIAVQMGMSPPEAIQAGVDRATQAAEDWETLMKSKGVVIGGMGPTGSLSGRIG